MMHPSERGRRVAPASVPAEKSTVLPDPVPPGGAEKLAMRLARELENEIVASGWPVGKALGNEDALVQRFGVSRWTVREALTITEADGLTYRQRGRLGGVVVGAPADDVVASSIRNYLLFLGINGAQLMEGLAALERLALSAAATRCSDQDRIDLTAMLAKPASRNAWDMLLNTQQLYYRMLKASHHPTLEVFTIAAAQLVVARGIYRGQGLPKGPAGLEIMRATAAIRMRQVQAVMDGDAKLAVDLGRELNFIWTPLLEQWDREPSHRRELSLAAAKRMAEQIGHLSGVPRPHKRSDTLALQIHHAILYSGLQPGEALASEVELMQRYDVGRGVLRDAIRSLERHGFLTTVEGRNGGLRVGRPTPVPTVRSALLYISFLNPDPDDLQHLASSLEQTSLTLACDAVMRYDTGPLMRWRESVRAREGDLEVPMRALGRRYYRGLGDATSNPLFALMLNILGSLYTLAEREDGAALPVDTADRERWLRSVAGVQEAVFRGDPQAAIASHRKVRKIGMMFHFRTRSVSELLSVGSANNRAPSEGGKLHQPTDQATACPST